MKDSAFVTTKGEYQGNASWSGNVWTLINEMVVRGLCDCGEKEIAAELALKTIRVFNHNCTEFVNPFDGSGHGVLQYAWSASQYLELIIETIFGISYRADEKVVTVSPKITENLKNECLELRHICLSKGVFLDVGIDHGIVSYRVSSDSIKVNVAEFV
jgi:glycogen debranching enzyme